MILFQTDKSTTIADLVMLTGIRPNNFWFEYFMYQIGQNIQVFEDFETLITFLQPAGDRHKLILKLNEYEIDGRFFDHLKIFALDQSIFTNTGFTKLKSRKMKIVEVNLNG